MENALRAHGYSDSYGFDSYQATYAGCYDVVFVASFFVGLGRNELLVMPARLAIWRNG